MRKFNWFLTALTEYPSENQHVIGYYEKFEDIFNVILDTEKYDLQESYYMFLVAELVGEGIQTLSMATVWFKWDGLTKSWTRCLRVPTQYENTTNFAS